MHSSGGSGTTGFVHTHTLRGSQGKRGKGQESKEGTERDSGFRAGGNLVRKHFAYNESNDIIIIMDHNNEKRKSKKRVIVARGVCSPGLCISRERQRLFANAEPTSVGLLGPG